jgi:ribonuclease P protein component
MTTTFTFDKEERLKSKKTIDTLFLNNGISAFNYPIKAVYNIVSNPDYNPTCPAIVITVPKKKFKSSVARNKIKRQIREAYRLNSEAIKLYCKENKLYIPLVFIYIAAVNEPYLKIEDSLKKILKTIVRNHGSINH